MNRNEAIKGTSQSTGPSMPRLTPPVVRQAPTAHACGQGAGIEAANLLQKAREEMCRQFGGAFCEKSFF
ncbi:hypothetical protein AB0N62_37265 [Streptomyces sp. NPDC093982]|uniref:hypothetical protein n=1 Tax=Streptomyces sp. NPDC093982 TaxID=3155077 RepID=UPI003448B50C